MERNALRVTKGVSSRSTCRRPERLPVVPMMRDTLPSRRCRSESASIKAVLSKPVGASGRMIFSVFLRAVPVPHPISCVFQRKGWSDTGVSGAGGLVQRPSANSVNCSATGFSQDCGVSDQGGGQNDAHGGFYQHQNAEDRTLGVFRELHHVETIQGELHEKYRAGQGFLHDFYLADFYRLRGFPAAQLVNVPVHEKSPFALHEHGVDSLLKARRVPGVGDRGFVRRRPCHFCSSAARHHLPVCICTEVKAPKLANSPVAISKRC